MSNHSFVGLLTLVFKRIISATFDINTPTFETLIFCNQSNHTACTA
jgi:hypothetical protein